MVTKDKKLKETANYLELTKCPNCGYEIFSKKTSSGFLDIDNVSFFLNNPEDGISVICPDCGFKIFGTDKVTVKVYDAKVGKYLLTFSNSGTILKIDNSPTSEYSKEELIKIIENISAENPHLGRDLRIEPKHA